MFNDIEELFQKGVELQKSGKVEVASQFYTAALKAQPEHPDANHNMGTLAVGFDKIQEALPFFEVALEANADTAQFWVSYIDALIKVERMADAQAVFDQAKNNGAKGDGFDRLEKRLNVPNGVPIESVVRDQALGLAKKKAKEGSLEDTKRIYQDILVKFSENKRAIDGIKGQASGLASKASKAQEPSQDQVQSLINLYNQGQLAVVLEQAQALIEQYPGAFAVWNLLGAAAAQIGKLDQAILAFQKVISIKPDYAEAHLNMGIAFKEQGKLEEAIEAYNKALAIKTNYAEAYLNMGIALQEQGKLEEAIEAYNKALAIKPDYADAYNNMGNALQEQDKLEEAIEAYNKALAIKPDYADAYNNMGLTLQDQGKLEEAIEAYRKTLAIKPDHVEVYNNLGNTLQDQGKLEEAIKAYRKALAIRPDYAETFNNMGVALQEQGKLEEAIEAYRKALAIKPDYAAYNNKGFALHEQGKLEDAIEAYNKALALKPNYADAHYNMGITLQKQEKLEEAIKAYNKALAIKPDYADAFDNMGNAFKEQGRLDEAIEAHNKALAIRPDYAEGYNNIYFPLQAMKTQISSEQELAFYYPENKGSKYSQIATSILNYRLKQGGESKESSLNEALGLLSTTENISIKNPTFNRNSCQPAPVLPNKIVALVHFGRAGTGLLHSLIDGQPEVSTLPSIYLSEYFDHSTWEKITEGGWYEMVDRFVSIYEVLFDAASTVPIKTKSKKLIHNIGQKEGMANVGENRNEVLRVDKKLFRAELNQLMAFYVEVDAFVFFKLVHNAFDVSINCQNHKKMIFYHIHNPDKYAQLNFVRLAPTANWVMMVRDPIQSCESWLVKDFQKNKYEYVANKIFDMLFEIDNIIYHKQSSIGVRLEDLKEKPRQTIPALCKWMGIEESESLYQMTAQGKKWWGDPSSPDFEKDGMEPFGQTSIKRKVGSIFSEKDQFILRTLFYPFSVKFGYVEENFEQFKIDLQAIGPKLNEIFDFEKAIVEQTEADPELFTKSGSYLYLRSGLIERWNTLNEHHTYSNMIKRLKIN